MTVEVPKCLTRVCARLNDIIQANPNVFGPHALLYRSGNVVIWRPTRDVPPRSLTEFDTRAWLAAALGGSLTPPP